MNQLQMGKAKGTDQLRKDGTKDMNKLRPPSSGFGADGTDNKLDPPARNGKRGPDLEGKQSLEPRVLAADRR
jgi:hypothetical protein